MGQHSMISIYICDPSFLKISYATTWLVAYRREDNFAITRDFSLFPEYILADEAHIDIYIYIYISTKCASD